MAEYLAAWSLAKQFALNLSTIQRWAKRGCFKSYDRNGDRVFDVQEVLAYARATLPAGHRSFGRQWTPAEVFWNCVDKNGPAPAFRPELGSCWLWNGALDQNGYGRCAKTPDIRTAFAHRRAYIETHGAIRDNLPLDHLCRVPRCVNPDHLEPVTHRENILRGIGPSAQNARMTECHRGHPLAGENLRFHGNKRVCRTCHRQSAARLRARAKSATTQTTHGR